MLLGSFALAASTASRAQQRPLPLVGFLDSAAATAEKLAAFFEGLQIEGYVRNRTVAVEYHSAQGDYNRLPALAADLVNRRVSLIAAIGTAAALAAKGATSETPIVFAITGDPVQLGLAASLDNPGGNATGVANLAIGNERKRLELLHELFPTAALFSLIVNPRNPNAEAQTRDALATARDLNIQITIVRASSNIDFEAAFVALAESQAAGLAISDDELFSSNSAELAALAVRHAVPVVFQGRPFAAAGGLMAYGGRLSETYHQVGVYSGLVLKGAAAAGLPVFQSTRSEFIINLRTAKSLGITVPADLLSRADEIIK